ncbi:SDR family NAD(P)-dependent oxidoreductase [Pigmentiphaga sp. H8]|uniref:SDR family NAD(P)-dependent oxidoreductase n=1 Tax=Pigmentiphaga sp. H8 TaxID=2488560 RepID=UPI00137545AD|nr:SDR family oxidoreductase [Pigmentiphaga sp. H8]
MDLGLEGKVVLVTGGSRGIGWECARVFGLEGARVALASRGEEGLREARRQLAELGVDATAIPVDFRDGEKVRKAVDAVETALGPIDVLVNSAGSAKHYPPEHDDHGRWRTGMEDKYLSSVHALDAVVPRMGHRGGGVVVNIAGAGGKVSNPMHMPGGAANAAIILVASAMAKAWGPRGVRVNTINPGAIETERLAAALRVKAETSGKTMEQVRSQALSAIPLGRYGRGEEIAWLCAFLASDRAGYISGATIAIDGGATCLA